MAIALKNYDTEFKLLAPAVVCRVEVIVLTRTSLSYTVRWYADVSARYFREEAYTIPHDCGQGGDPFALAYDHMLGHPDYAGGVFVDENAGSK